MLHVFYFSFRWGPFVHSLGIVQWNSTRRDHPGNPGGVFGSGPVIVALTLRTSRSGAHEFIDQGHTPQNRTHSGDY